jgi:hypothetical protein
MSTEPTLTTVRVTDIDLPFWSIVRLVVKWTVASIPAFLILALLAAAAASASAFFLNSLKPFR